MTMRVAVLAVVTAFGAIAGCMSLDGGPSQTASSARNPALEKAATAINETMRGFHFNPRALDRQEYLAIEAATLQLGRNAADIDAFVSGFDDLWRDAPFSHVNLSKAQGTAEETAAYLDQMEAGDDAVELRWLQGQTSDIAILTVNTMMGSDTINAIDAAFETIAAKKASHLIIDLRANNGGAFAVRPLVGHLMSTPYDAGIFASRLWFDEHDRAPQKSDIADLEPWTGWSIRRFWADATRAPLTRVQFAPVDPVFDGPVIVLTSAKTASAAELAADALKGSGRAAIIGEKTAGQMLSQRPFDIPGGMHLFLPIADYYSLATGRIEGNGVLPDIEQSADGALERALNEIGAGG